MKKTLMATIAGLFVIIFSTSAFAEAREIVPGSQEEIDLRNEGWQSYGPQLPCYSDMQLSVAPAEKGAESVVVTVVMDTLCRTDDNGTISQKSVVGAKMYVFDYGGIAPMRYNRIITKLLLNEAYTSAPVDDKGTVTLQYLMPASGPSMAFFEPVLVYADEDLTRNIVSRSWMGPSGNKNDAVQQAHGGTAGPGSKGGHVATLFAFYDGMQVRLTPAIAMDACLHTPSNDNSLNYYDQCAVEKQAQYWAVSKHTPVSGPQDMSAFMRTDNLEVEAAKQRKKSVY